MSKTITEIVRRVYDNDNNGVFIEVGPDSDVLDNVTMQTTEAESRSWYGEFSVSMTPHMAKAIGHALIATADEALVEETP